MNVLKRAARLFRPRLAEQILVSLVSLALLFATWPQNLAAQDGQAPPPEQATQQAPPSNGQAPEYTQQTPEQLQQLVAPIPPRVRPLVAQILAASTFPEQVVEADRWVQAHPDLKGERSGQGRGPAGPWDPSVKALDGVSDGPRKHGQESFVDVVARRRLRQPAAGRDGKPCR